MKKLFNKKSIPSLVDYFINISISLFTSYPN